MIIVDNVSMEYRLHTGGSTTFKEFLFASKSNKIPVTSIKALEDVSFDVKKGEIFGVIGGNGAGKSTLLKLLAGIMKPTTGSIKVDGVIAPMIELGTGFDFELSAIENIYLSGAILGFSKAYITDKIVDIFNFAELWDFKDVPVKYFSSGMLARLAFAVSTTVVPDVLIVDEILAVGDLSFQKKSLTRMHSLMQSGATVIYVSHNIDSVKGLCDRVLWLEKGKTKAIGSAQEVCDSYLKNIL